MALGAITATTTEHVSMAALNTVLSTYTSEAGTAGADKNTFIITYAESVFYLTRLVRAQA